jgi:hypothetical protein
MAKIVSLRERVHQPFYDHLIRTAGMAAGQVQDSNTLFTPNANRSEATTNLVSGNQLPSDQSHVTLVLRVFLWFRNPILRVDGDDTGEVAQNGDYGSLLPYNTGGVGFGNAPADTHDVFRMYHQSAEQIHWTFGAGIKPSLENIPSYYLPAGGGLYGDLATASDLILLNNGMPTQESILRLGRAVLIPPRQAINVQARIFALPDGSNSQAFGSTQGSRNMLSARDNLNAVDGMAKMISFYLDGLFSRDVQ